jgi:hypothetical protein
MMGKVVFDNYPKITGDNVDATVPNADANPIASPLICEGNSSVI